MTKTKESRTYVRPDNTAVITCPHCGRQKTMQVDAMKEHKSKLKIKCACKDIFTAIIEFRKRKRKITSLQGSFVNLSQKGHQGSMRVMNVSISGLEFTTTEGVERFKVDDELNIEFTLQDDYRSVIRKEAIVRSVRPNSVGCEFVEAAVTAFDGPLGRYIIS
ncbi:MAG: hypothetical protein JRF02_00815 [Deltaproteobacteria bacterium]|jgi:hypothetical protein|nr:hypothetical protein [Deltaproteobacteria bacterium]